MILPIATSLKLIELLTIPRKGDYNRIKSILTGITSKKQMLLTNKGRDAIYHALKDMGLTKDDEVIIQGYTCSIVREAVKAVCKPVFVDIDIDTLNIDFKKMEKAITKKTKAILVVHSYGSAVDMNRIMKLAQKHKLKIIEDCAQALKTKFNNKYVGSFGDYATFSFGYSKDLTVFKGGVLLSNNKIEVKLKKEGSIKAFIENSAVFYGMAFIESMPVFIRNMFTAILVRPYVKGNQEIFNASDLAPSNYAVSLICKQFSKLDSIIDKRVKTGEYYNKEFEELGLKLQKAHRFSPPTYFRYTVLVKNRRKVCDEFLKQNIRLGALYDFFIAPEGACPVSERVSKEMINLPVHHKLKKRHVKKIAKVTKKILAHD